MTQTTKTDLRQLVGWIALLGIVLTVYLVVAKGHLWQKADMVFVPRSLPLGFSEATVANDVISNTTYGIGFVKKYCKASSCVTVITFKKELNVNSWCDYLKTENIKAYLLKGSKVNHCRLQNISDGLPYQMGYSSRDGYLVTTKEDSEPFLTEQELYDLFESLEPQKR